MRLNLVHYYRNVCGGNGPTGCHPEHVGTAAFPTMREATLAADAHSEDHQFACAVQIDAPDLFELDELELIVAAVDAMKPSPVNNAPIHKRLRSLRVKAASLAFGMVAGV